MILSIKTLKRLLLSFNRFPLLFLLERKFLKVIDVQRCKFLVKGESYNQSKFLLETNNLNELKECINSFISKKVKKVYYDRFNLFEDHIWIDFGSWNEFIYIYFLNQEAREEFLNSYRKKE